MKTRLLIVLVLATMLLAGLIPTDSASAASCTWYVVKKGDNLTQIARRHGVSVNSIVRANNIKNRSVIYRGQRLCIPTGSSTSPPPNTKCVTGCYKTHVVKRGEYLKVIAPRYGTTVACISSVNGIKNANRIYTGQKLKIPVPCAKPQPKPVPKPPAAKPWRGAYFTNRSLAGNPKFIRYQPKISFNWGTGGPQHLGKVDDFSIRFTRTMYFEGGRYLFHIKTKDGVRLLIDDKMVLNEWHDVPQAANYHVERALGQGNHKIQLDYYNHAGPAQVHLQIERIAGGQPPPPPDGPWHARYWNNRQLQGEPAWTTKYEDVVFDWGKGSPNPRIAADYFSARYIGDFYFKDGKYRFYAMSDDGVRIWLDRTLILDQWRVQGRTAFSSDVDVPEGNHRIRVDYFENTGGAALKVFWNKK